MKIRGHAHGNYYHADAEVPDQLPSDARFWIEIEAGDGTREAACFLSNDPL